MRVRTTKDLFQKELHAYTITHAIEDRNVLRFHVDYYKPNGTPVLKSGQTLTKQAIAQAILDKHDVATGGRRFNALLATASINDAIEYYKVFKQLQTQCQVDDPEFVPLKVTAVFSPPAEGNLDVQRGVPPELIIANECLHGEGAPHWQDSTPVFDTISRAEAMRDRIGRFGRASEGSE